VLLCRYVGRGLPNYCWTSSSGGSNVAGFGRLLTYAGEQGGEGH